jgi:hypothetical protein
MVQQCVVLKCERGVFRVDQRWEGALREVLTYGEHAVEPGPAGIVVRRRTGQLYNREEDGRLAAPANLAPVVADHLAGRGLSVQLTDSRPRPQRLKTIDSSLLDVVTTPQRELLELCAKAHSGLIRYDPGVSPDRIVALICRLFPVARIAIGLPGKKKVRDVYRGLRRAIGNRVRTVKDVLERRWDPSPYVLVATLRCLEHCQPFDWDLVLLPDAPAIVAPGYQIPLVTLHGYPVFGLVGAGMRLSRRERLPLIAKSGPLLFTMAGTPPRRPVRVVGVTPPHMHPGQHADPLARKRAVFWGNHRRNGFLAQLAVALSEKDEQTLMEFGLEPVSGASGGAPRVVVLVESPEHGRALVKRLPEWQLLVGDTACDEDDTTPDRAVVTLVRAARMQEIRADVLIHASGEDAVGLAGFPPRAEEGKGEALLIELIDDADEVARSATHTRLRAYRDRGWNMTCRGPR